ncbi:MAG: MerR family transcriptional regulator [Betaproteobacteria bacterium]|nr:MerR family transcriptional regulator [Betaproteobacteria bacterium]
MGNLAKHAKVGVETIRCCQNFGLLQVLPKPNTGYRQYPKEALERLHLVAVRAVLEELIHQCDANPYATGSPIVSALSGANNPS